MYSCQLELQKILLPYSEQYHQQWKLFYRGEQRLMMDGAMLLPKYSINDFSTYLNTFSLRKWKKYTNMQSLMLSIEICGKFRLKLTSYQLDVETVVRTVVYVDEFEVAGREKLYIEYPETNASLLSFEIEALSECIFYGGSYSCDVDEVDLRKIHLSLVSTTFKKEDFIRKNISILKTELLEKDEDLREGLTIHVVDNGRTLGVDEFDHPSIRVHPNKNVGGSGGFARGMIESLYQDPKATHVLLMDDDVLILPESIKRTYRLLSLLKEEYYDCFISGAMLCYEKMYLQHEDVGYVHINGSYGPEKKGYDLTKLEDILSNEEEPLLVHNRYAGWWYCCIPIMAIEKNGLPLPLFIRGDDVEFSLRNQAQFITMNGICVWHMGFAYKFSASMELYQVHRNSLILQAVSGVCTDIDFVARMKKLFRSNLLSLNYDASELILDAFEDYLKGPDFIKEDIGESVMREKGKKNEKMIDLRELSNVQVNFSEVYEMVPRRFLSTWLYRITYNGHRLCPQNVLRDVPAVVAFDWFYNPERQFWRKKLVAVNPFLQQAAIRELDRVRYRQLIKRYRTLMKTYVQKAPEIKSQYEQSKSYLVSEEFWRHYLGDTND